MKQMRLFSLLILLAFYGCISQHSPQVVETIHGTIELDDPLALELIQHPSFQRMKDIQQHGLNHKALGEPSYTRFEHSLGVYALLKKYRASRAEQIAGLLHDVSHTAYSHVGDTFFGHKDGEYSWQDLDHDNFLIQSGLAKVVKAHGLSLKEVSPKQVQYTRLERDLPDLCADRINYILHGGMILKRISPQEVKEINEALAFDLKTQKWFFKDTKAAFTFSQASLWQTENCWGHSGSFHATERFVEAVREGIKQKVIVTDDFRFGTDTSIWSKLQKSKHPKIIKLLDKVMETPKHYQVKKQQQCTAPYKHHSFKLRGVDPLVLHQGKLARLSMVHPSYGKDFALFKKTLSKGRCVELL